MATQRLRVLMLSWEYPPLVVGGLGRHVGALATRLVAEGHDVLAVTRGEKDVEVDEVLQGVRVRRSACDPIDISFSAESLLAWSQAAEHSLIRAALPLVRRWRPDVVHAHDWLVAQSAATLSAQVGRPVVATIHATEAGRHQGWLPAPLNRSINSVERWLVLGASEVITCSSAMREEVGRVFGRPADAMHVVPNGIDAPVWRVPARVRDQARMRLAPNGPLVVYAGRLMGEKGVASLLRAHAVLRRRFPEARLVIAGTGPEEQRLRELARRLRIARAVEFAGFVFGTELAALLAAADVAVVPSLYEPFGIVALEAAAAGTAVAMAATGGLTDLIANGVAAAHFTPDDPDGIATAVAGLLADPDATRRAVARAARIVRRDYSWDTVAERTAAIYTSSVGHSSGVMERRSRMTRAGAPTATL